MYWLATLVRLLDFGACVNLKQNLHNVINISDFEWRLQCWEMLLRYLFACNKVHYARYGNFYINFLAYVKATHPKTETKAKLRQVAMTVRRKNSRYGW